MKYSYSTKLILLCFIVISVSAYNFNDYVAQFEKKYQNESEEAFRRQIFNANYTIIMENNLLADAVPMAPTIWTDRTQCEVKAALSFRPNMTGSPDAFPVFNGRVSAPRAVDWRTQNVVTPIKSQGNCGSCWAFTVTACTESYLIIKNKTTYDLAQQFLLECTRGSSCNGGSFDKAMKQVLNTGMPLDATYPYTASRVYDNSYKKYPGICSAVGKKLPKAAKVYSWNSLSSQQVKERVAESPLAIGIAADTSFLNFRNSSVFSCKRTVYSFQINHAVLLIGYDSDGNYIIKNSWGTKWGNQGYALLDKTYSCGVGSIVSQYSDMVVVASDFASNSLESSSKTAETATLANAYRLVFGLIVFVLVILH